MPPRVAVLGVACGVFAVACGGEPSTTRVPSVPSGPPTTPTTPSSGPTPVHADRECNTASDCRTGETCFAPDFQPRGVTPCRGEDFCRSMGGQVCSSGGMCVAPCTDTSCAPGYSCRPPRNPGWPQGRLCEPLKCDAPGALACAAKFSCNPTSGVCDRMSCKTAADCGAEPRACWNGQCFDHGGACRPSNACCPP